MSTNQTLLQAFQQASYPVAGHSKRTVQELKRALESVDANLAGDMYGTGHVIEDFQARMAAYLGKESAVFFPSGTMAQQIALRIWCDQKNSPKVAYHPLCHLEIHEKDGLKELHHIEAQLLADTDRLIRLDDVEQLDENVACLLLELPQREIGGQLPDYSELEAISAFCRERGIKLHMDGARLFEITPYYQKTAAEICSLFDSVYVSFYKGIGGIAGAILAGESEFTETSKVWKRRHGGDLISLYPYTISSDYYFEQRVGRMQQYYEGAKDLASRYNQCYGFRTIPAEPVSNMFHVHVNVSAEELEPQLISIYEATGIGLTGNLRPTSESSCYFEVSIGDRYTDLPKSKLMEAFQLLDAAMKQI
ncbi:aminotransferase class I/II-fold pyridoxal phosphate-dependent enzyme [Paenibacillus albiflavus]|uniref:Aminotransferase class I/II-fold pyridoxal phosphate-dependent enzyme n=1 Tax=Paenibacillus albiflavus TaxID=2545760 RepID=A0A4R4EG20_9BACL|nr:aminotransferase class I/II-fold pyridoxal phosphate-dependent enzyme [Paenibacillus albiflavus]TCZ78233.1 aminotransferase class I/II-fold pyridoxal phosphate-dependent enzyme [Paenibacillus albiflavus]